MAWAFACLTQLHYTLTTPSLQSHYAVPPPKYLLRGGPQGAGQAHKAATPLRALEGGRLVAATAGFTGAIPAPAARQSVGVTTAHSV